MKKPKVLSAGDVLGIIPDSLLDQFAQDSGVDVQVKKLKGKTILQLFLYGALNFRTISQRILAAVYASDEFRMLFETTGNAVKFSAISMRLGNIKVSYFENIFNYLINSKQVSSVCFADTKVGIEKLDSTFLGLSSKLLKFGMDFNPGRKNLKFAVKLSGSIPIDIQLFTDSSEISEDRVFPKLLMEKQQKQALNIAIFDRGMNKRENFINLNQNNGVIWNLTKADKSAKMIIGKTLTNYHYGNIGTTGFGTIFSSGHI